MAKKEFAKAVEANKYSFGASALVGDRKSGLSWAKIAEKRELGSPASARRTIATLTGKPHTDFPLPEGKGGRPAGSGNGEGNGWTEVSLEGVTTVAALRQAIGGLVVRVQPLTKAGKPRQFLAAKVQKLSKGDQPEFELTDTEGKTHTIRASAVDATRPAQ
jgi:hypothetical protein